MVERDRLGNSTHLPKSGYVRQNNAVKRHAFCMRKRVKYVTAHAQKFSDITICILVPWYMYFTYPNFSLIRTFLGGNLSNGVRITEDALYINEVEYCAVLWMLFVGQNFYGGKKV